MKTTYPPVSFYFKLSFSGVSGQAEASFKEVSGLTMEIGTTEIEEGGTLFKHRVPTTSKTNNLVLKRGLMPKNSAVFTWCQDTIGGELQDFIETKTIMVHLLDPSRKPLKSWSFKNAWPVKWSLSDLNSMNNDIAIESLEFAFSTFQAK